MSAPAPASDASRAAHGPGKRHPIVVCATGHVGLKINGRLVCAIDQRWRFVTRRMPKR